jgi:hypothetical protein
VTKPPPAEGAWQKSTASDDTGCVEVALHENYVLVRHSLDRSGPVLRFSSDEWEAFLTGVRNGEFSRRHQSNP